MIIFNAKEDVFEHLAWKSTKSVYSIIGSERAGRQIETGGCKQEKRWQKGSQMGELRHKTHANKSCLRDQRRAFASGVRSPTGTRGPRWLASVQTRSLAPRTEPALGYQEAKSASL